MASQFTAKNMPIYMIDPSTGPFFKQKLTDNEWAEQFEEPNMLNNIDDNQSYEKYLDYEVSSIRLSRNSKRKRQSYGNKDQVTGHFISKRANTSRAQKKSLRSRKSKTTQVQKEDSSYECICGLCSQLEEPLHDYEDEESDKNYYYYDQNFSGYDWICEVPDVDPEPIIFDGYNMVHGMCNCLRYVCGCNDCRQLPVQYNCDCKKVYDQFPSCNCEQCLENRK